MKNKDTVSALPALPYSYLRQSIAPVLQSLPNDRRHIHVVPPRVLADDLIHQLCCVCLGRDDKWSDSRH